MAKLRKMLVQELERIPGIDIHLWRPDRDFVVIDYKGKEVAHFHGINELDIRLSPEFVKREGLVHASNRVGHPNRKNGGTWLIVRFTRESHLSEMIRLVKIAIKLR